MIYTTQIVIVVTLKFVKSYVTSRVSKERSTSSSAPFDNVAISTGARLSDYRCPPLLAKTGETNGKVKL